jgi:hypothetical protein
MLVNVVMALFTSFEARSTNPFINVLIALKGTYKAVYHLKGEERNDNFRR